MQIRYLRPADVLALGFMTFALFVGAGNVIFPPLIGLQAGQHVWSAAAGFLITAVSLPVLTIVALARTGGELDSLSQPLGRRGAMLLAVLCYLAVGPLFATPRTASVSFAVGVAGFSGDTVTARLAYSAVYFGLVALLSLYPGRLLDSVGKVLAPLKILALAALGLCALCYPAGGVGPTLGEYREAAFGTGFEQGYLTMDALGGLVFGIVIVNAIRSRGVSAPRLLTRYAVIAALIAGLGLTLVYLSLFWLGAGSAAILPGGADNGAQILRAYVEHTLGGPGVALLSALIVLACFVTAVGLTCACAEYFSERFGLGYRSLVLLLALFAFAVSNLGLTELIKLSLPVLVAVYPPCIVLVGHGLLARDRARRSPPLMLAMGTALLFGMVDGAKAIGAHNVLTEAIGRVPLASLGLAWLLPVLAVALLARLVLAQGGD